MITLEFPQDNHLPDPREEGRVYRKKTYIFAVRMEKRFKVKTLHGEVEGKAGDWLAKGSSEEMWPIDAKVFSENYEEVG